MYTISRKKLSKSRLSDCFFFGYFLVISEVGSPDYIAKLAIFQKLSVLGDFYALNHFVCHRYT